ncbi:glutathione S-transferase family protein [Pseudomonas nunensis]|uniref:Glutathione S-transferase family protein n=1 Tax=Pseudomonas nunensis TaxID=2961896 RepID=A0ABY5ESA0_9PSED|nr:glutathione S-transferase family protein [Pseudomonas nunensis]KPN91392.1 glutathione S-transferase [Pseudomonas nunensis]MCL5229939.1 glutathione S-transferase family protein [Pseudomonas nunensis]UTO17670.1 glutathione S-transferase family protein [Pseudomonas nunensis]
MPLTLYYHPLSSYCHKVLIALYENGHEFEKRIVDLASEADRAELQARWPIGKFPVVHDHTRERDVPESTIIIEYLNRFYPGPQPLVPEDWEAALEVRLWDRFFDLYVQGPMQRIVADRLFSLHGDLTKERALLSTAYHMLERRMASRIWVASEAFSLADCAAVPALFYASTLLPFPNDCGHLSANFERLIQRPSVQRVIEEAKPYFQFYPFAEAIPLRFR